MNRITEQDEFLLSQLLDGDLPDEQAEALRARIAREPALRTAFEGLERIDALLTRQRRFQPEVDFSSLRSQVMQAVRSSSQPRVIRFPIWTWAASAVAAAAAIALVLTFWPAGPAETVDPGRLMVENTRQAPAPEQVAPAAGSQRETMLVQFNRPRYERRTSELKVSYVRSADLANAMSARDRERRGRPTWHMYVAQRASIPAPAASPFDLPL